jgi:hypothetical protein
MRNVIPIEIAAPNIMAVTRYPLQSALRNLFLGSPKTLKKDLLLTIAIMIVAMIQKITANFA